MDTSRTAHAKSAAILIGTLVLGMLLGALLHARVTEERMERIAYLRSPQGFVGFFEGAIEPRDEAQKQAIREILDRSSARIGEAARERRSEIRRIIHSTRDELSLVLTEEQNAQLEQQLAERREQYKERRARHRERKKEYGQGNQNP